MSELIQKHDSRAAIRWKLLTGASAVALLTYVYSAEQAKAEDSDRPQIWIELGGQLEGMSGSEQAYVAPFIASNFDKHQNAVSPLSPQEPPHYSIGGESKISFEPQGTDWIFSAAIRFGRSNGSRSMNQQTASKFVIETAKYAQKHGFTTITNKLRFDNSRADYHDDHAILDFSAGKDVGFGLFGHRATSTFGAGVRFAQFKTNSTITFRSLPSHYIGVDALIHLSHQHNHSYYALLHAEREFKGVGPSISWDGSAPFAGNPDRGAIAFDWGVNAAALFGRQKVRGKHETTGRYFFGNYNATMHYAYVVPLDRSRSIVVPNVGGFAGLSVRYTDAKISIGYRADFFFNAIDNGIDTRKTDNRAFNGPYASISIGLGD